MILGVPLKTLNIQVILVLMKFVARFIEDYYLNIWTYGLKFLWPS